MFLITDDNENCRYQCIYYLFIYYLQIMNDEWKIFFAFADVIKNSDMI
jgi:hypothetical protein